MLLVWCLLLCGLHFSQGRPRYPSVPEDFEHQETIHLDLTEENNELIKSAEMLSAFLIEPSASFRVLHNRVQSLQRFNKHMKVPIDKDYNLFPFEYGREIIKPHIEQAIEELPTERVYYIQPARPVEEAPQDYDYDELKDEFYHDEEPANVTVVVPLDEEVGETVAQIIDLKLPRNCSAEEKSGIGALAFECLMHDLKNVQGEERRRIVILVFKWIGVWVLLTLLVSTIIWCQSGWFFCFRLPCRCLNPRLIQRDIRTYLVTHEPGKLEAEDGSFIKYEPLEEEVEAYQHLMDALQDF